MYIIGVDAGGSKTRALVSRAEDGQILGEAISRGANYQQMGPSKTAEIVAETISLALEPVVNWENKERVVALGVGAAGCGREEEQQALKKELQQLQLAENVTVVDDGKAALISAWQDQPGIVLIAGTGSIAYALDKEDNFHRSGGWGPLLGDQGSGCWLGLTALQKALKLANRGEYAWLNRLLEQFAGGLDNLTELLNYIYDPKKQQDRDELLPRQELARLAPLILSEAEAGKRRPFLLAEQGAEELTRLLVPLVQKVGIKDRKIALAGGLMENEFYRNLTINKAKAKLDKYNEIVKMELEPVYGALIIAQKIAVNKGFTGTWGGFNADD